MAGEVTRNCSKGHGPMRKRKNSSSRGWDWQCIECTRASGRKYALRKRRERGVQEKPRGNPLAPRDCSKGHGPMHRVKSTRNVCGFAWKCSECDRLREERKRREKGVKPRGNPLAPRDCSKGHGPMYRVRASDKACGFTWRCAECERLRYSKNRRSILEKAKVYYQRNRTAITAKTRERRRRLIEAGLCAQCGSAPPLGALVLCATCRDVAIEKGRDRRHMIVDALCCPSCEGFSDGQLCPECREEKNLRSRVRYWNLSETERATIRAKRRRYYHDHSDRISSLRRERRATDPRHRLGELDRSAEKYYLGRAA